MTSTASVEEDVSTPSSIEYVCCRREETMTTFGTCVMERVEDSEGFYHGCADDEDRTGDGDGDGDDSGSDSNSDDNVDHGDYDDDNEQKEEGLHNNNDSRENDEKEEEEEEMSFDLVKKLLEIDTPFSNSRRAARSFAHSRRNRTFSSDPTSYDASTTGFTHQSSTTDHRWGSALQPPQDIFRRIWE